jgi:predicted SAM-dependent methyltransferase
MKLNLDIACGTDRRKDYIGIDKSPNSDADIIRDIEKECLPFCDSCIDNIYSKNTLEHIDDIIFVFNEFWRVLKPNCDLEVSVPYRTHKNAIGVMHKRVWDEPAFDFFRQERSMKLYGLKGLWDIKEMVVNDEPYINVKMSPIKETPRKKLGHGLKIDIGCGRAKDRDKIGLDIDDYGQEIIWDIKDGMPFCKNSCHELKAYNVLEHFYPEELDSIMQEFHRVLKRGHILDIMVPEAGTDGAIRDPHHKNLWNVHKFSYFCKGTPKHYDYLPNHKWELITIKRDDRGVLRAALTPIKR